MLIPRRLVCSFCGRTAAQVSKLVAGRKGYICEACAAEAHRIMSGPAAAAQSSPPRPDGTWSRIRARVSRFWRPARRVAPGGANYRGA